MSVSSLMIFRQEYLCIRKDKSHVEVKEKKRNFVGFMILISVTVYVYYGYNLGTWIFLGLWIQQWLQIDEGTRRLEALDFFVESVFF